MKLRLKNANQWSVVRTGTARRRSAGDSAGIAIGADICADFLLPGVTIEHEMTVERRVDQRRGTVAPTADVEAVCGVGEGAIVIARHPSGAITFHAPVRQTATTQRRGNGKSSVTTFEFRVPVSMRGSGDGRRGIFANLVKLILVKVKDVLVDAAVGAAIKFGGVALEDFWWQKKGLKEGWFQVTPNNQGLSLVPGRPEVKSQGKSLLLLHGTFSDAANAFSGLATTPGKVFGQVRPLYGDRIYAFNHFSVTKTPAENARMLLEQLPASATTFDVISHSRGGLVLRTLVEQADSFGALSRRFQLNRGVMLAAPNQGTPLATPNRFEQTLGIMATILEQCPDNPWTVGAAFIAHGITWLASNAIVHLPGLASMDGAGEMIELLQSPSKLPPKAYSALAANFSPGDVLWRTLLDVGIDSYFGGANDLVVPSEGSWLINGERNLAIDIERIGCFGPGGNIRPDESSPVNHLNIVNQPETISFVVQMLKDQATGLPLLDPLRALPSRRLFRSKGPRFTSDTRTEAPFTHGTEPSELDERLVEQAAATSLAMNGTVSHDTLNLMILNSGDDNRIQILAIYDNARIVENFVTKNVPQADRDPNGVWLNQWKLFQAIVKTHRQIRMCLEGEPDPKTKVVPQLPSDAEMLTFGEHLFETLFTGSVRRLYDVARSQQRERPLNVVFTSNVPWLAALPWEFAFDPSRRKFLVTEEIHFIRNVFSAVPAQHSEWKSRKLRLLVVAAQPLDLAQLSVTEEEQRIRHAFASLTQRHLIELDVLTDATASRLHAKIQARELESRPGNSQQYDIVHFIGHGDFDKSANRGKLYFHTRNGGAQSVDVRTLREILCGRGIQLIFLNACDTAQDAKDTLNRGVAQALVEGGIPAVVANQYPVLDGSAVGFTDHFYWSLSQGASLGEAARESRIALNYSFGHESIDWAIPVLFARDATF